MSVRQLPVPSLRVSLPSYVWFVGALVVVWGLGDALSTLFALHATGDVGLEANPWIRMLLSSHPVYLPIFKGLVVAVAGGLLLGFRRYVESVPGWRLWFAGLLAVGSAIVAASTVVGVATLL